MFGGLRNAMQEHPVTAYVALALAISWGWWLLVAEFVASGGLTQGVAIPGAFGPAIAAAIVIWASGGSLRSWASQVLRWRIAPRWYLIALGLPIVLALVGVGGAIFLAGGPIDIGLLPERLPLFVASFLMATIIGGGQEELGWRGFAQLRLQESYSAFVASLAVGVVWAIWHLPLFLLGAPRNRTGLFVLYAALVVGFSILLTWQYNSTGGSVLLAMLMHGAINASGNLLPVPMGAVNRWPLVIDVGLVAAVWVAAVVVIVWSTPEGLSRAGIPEPARVRS